MKFELLVHPAALADLDAIHEHLADYSEVTAERTLALVKSAILGLSELPRRYAIAPESGHASIEIRHVIVGNYRVLYWIAAARQVHVIRVVHAARASLNPRDLL